MGNLVNYGGFDLESFDEDSKEVAKSGKSKEFVKIEEGDNLLRLLPPPKDAEWAQRPNGKISAFKVIHEHFVEVPGLSYKIRFVCPRMHGGGHCPTCAEADALVRTGNPFDKDKANDLRPSARTYCNVIERADEAAGPKIFAFSKMVRDGIQRLGSRGGDLLNPTEKGRDIIINKTVKGPKTDYHVEPCLDTSPLGNEEWLEQQYNLDSYAIVPTLEEIKEKLSGGSKGRTGTRDRVGSGVDRRQLVDGRGAKGKAAGTKPQGYKKRTAADDVLDDSAYEAVDAEFEEMDEADELPE